MGTYEVVHDAYYLSQIQERLYPLSSALSIDDPGRRYMLNTGDFFTVSLKSTNRTPSIIMREWLQVTAQAAAVFASYGGMVLNEDY